MVSLSYRCVLLVARWRNADSLSAGAMTGRRTYRFTMIHLHCERGLEADTGKGNELPC